MPELRLLEVRLTSFGVLAALLATSGVLAKVPERQPFTAPVTVEADGLATVGEVEGVQGKVAGIIREALAELRYVPGHLEGRPIASTVLVDGDVIFDPVAGAFDVVLARFQTQPRLLQWRPADFPASRRGAERDGAVSLVLQVAPDGQVARSDVASSTHEDFTRAAREAVAGWRFEPAPAAFEVGAAFWFHGNWAYPEVPEIPCPVPARLAHLRGDDGCLRISETTSDIVIHGSGGPYTPYIVRTPAPPSAGGRWFPPEE
ncbi:MAG TPA: energy transducer TonB [Xanthomonadaceae bacterium]|nr:energy transducer TonB [Xanthomonadaceae bacterium]